MSNPPASSTVLLISAGATTPSRTGDLAERIAAATLEHLHQQGVKAHVEHLHLREIAVDLARTLVEPGFASPQVVAAQRAVAACDGLIACTPVYSAGTSGLFKLFFDLLDPASLHETPTVIGATAGSMRHMLVLEHSVRPLLTFLHAPVMPTGVFATRADCEAETLPRLNARIDRAGRELAQAVATNRAFR